MGETVPFVVPPERPVFPFKRKALLLTLQFYRLEEKFSNEFRSLCILLSAPGKEIEIGIVSIFSRLALVPHLASSFDCFIDNIVQSYLPCSL